MGIRNNWVADPSTPERIAELLVRSFFALTVYLIAVYVIFVWLEATTDWFAALGFIAPLLWLLDWVLPSESCSSK